jgi:glycerate 2-kinase
MNKRQIAKEIFYAGVNRVKPGVIIHSSVSINENILQIENLKIDLDLFNNIYVIGAGKASAMMAQTIESILGERITAGHIITKYNHSVPLNYLEITEAGHPIPDENGIMGTERIIEIANKAGKDDLMLCLISGGGSSLLTDVPEGCTLDDVKSVNNILIKTGANISEMNCIRKHLSKVKGGLLAKAAFPAKVISLILSDVIGDPVDVIASGPTAPDPTTYDYANLIIGKYNIENEIPQPIYRILQEGSLGKRQETLKETDEAFLHTVNIIIGNNELALSAAREKAISFGYETHIITNDISGDVSRVSNYVIDSARKTIKEKATKKICLLFGGEPTVKVKGNGQGGRNQHLALLAAQLLKDEKRVTILSGGTDGTDGSTDAAGAVSDSSTLINAKKLNLDIENYINNYDSHSFFLQEGGLVITGPTQTNVMDLIILLIN